jgi:hypothetical protein
MANDTRSRFSETVFGRPRAGRLTLVELLHDDTDDPDDTDRGGRRTRRRARLLLTVKRP